MLMLSSAAVVGRRTLLLRGRGTTRNSIATAGGAADSISSEKRHRRHYFGFHPPSPSSPYSPSPPPSVASLVPIVLENSGAGERSFDIYSRLLRERIICVHGEVTDPMASLVTAQLLFLESEAPKKPLYMYINSPGGVITAGMAMYDTMQYVSPEVHTICMGQAASMGSLLLAGGAPGCRYALPNARIMVHQPRGGAHGVAADIDIQAKEILRTRANLNDLYVHHTGKSLDEIERVMDRDTFLGAEEAVEFGIVDEVLRKRDDVDATGAHAG